MKYRPTQWNITYFLVGYLSDDRQVENCEKTNFINKDLGGRKWNWIPECPTLTQLVCIKIDYIFHLIEISIIITICYVCFTPMSAMSGQTFFVFVYHEEWHFVSYWHGLVIQCLVESHHLIFTLKKVPLTWIVDQRNIYCIYK